MYIFVCLCFLLCIPVVAFALCVYIWTLGLENCNFIQPCSPWSIVWRRKKFTFTHTCTDFQQKLVSEDVKLYSHTLIVNSCPDPHTIMLFFYAVTHTHSRVISMGVVLGNELLWKWEKLNDLDELREEKKYGRVAQALDLGVEVTRQPRRQCEVPTESAMG